MEQGRIHPSQHRLMPHPNRRPHRWPPRPSPRHLYNPPYDFMKIRDVNSLVEQGWQLTCGPEDKGDEYVGWLRPATTWREAGLGALLEQNLPPEWETPTAVQSITLSNLGLTKDIIINANTGCGKTGAYLLPILKRLLAEGVAYVHGTYLVVVGLTLELADQIHADAERLCRGTGINVLKITKNYSQLELEAAVRGMQGRTHVVVATIGKLSSMVRESRSFLNVSSAKYLVVDEADKIAAHCQTYDTFHEHMDLIKGRLPREHRTLACSATCETSLSRMLFPRQKRNQGKYKGVALVQQDSWMVSNSDRLQIKVDVHQIVEEAYRDSYDERMRRSVAFIDTQVANDANAKVILFSQKAHLAAVASDLRRHLNNTPVYEVQGDMTAHDRTTNMESFKRSSSKCILVGSYGTVCRGIDVDCPLVIMFHMPDKIMEYKHAIGRTARAGRKGTSYAFYSESDRSRIKREELEEMVRSSGGEWRDLQGITRRYERGAR
eukprot:TRINITY_DN1617_c0_g1_i2.p1 TRINITY_DN1617_c0_g1~~TRINITY_DN1617_c0_g1_i2.p1  ORF type:complete len:493 (+),score=117.40 TRINITY_DN1617_c0_g1_i2:405-1883(+)